MSIRRGFAVMAVVLALMLTLVATPAQAAPSRGGAVANSCAVKAEVMVARKTRGGINPTWLKCGEAKGPVDWATVTTGPFYVKLPGTKPICLKAGQRFYPNNSGFERTAVITPTRRCSR